MTTQPTLQPAIATGTPSVHVALGPLERVSRILASTRFSCLNEAELQTAVQRTLDAGGVTYQREHRLSRRDRVDFLIEGGLALELKVRTSKKNALSQVLRYAEHDAVSAVLVASTTHLAINLPGEAHGKPLRTIHLVGF